MARRKIQAGSTSVQEAIFVRDTTSTTGGGLASLVFNTSGLVAEYRGELDASWTAITLVTKTLGTYVSGGFVADGSLTGAYAFDPPNACFASARGKWCNVRLYGAANMLPVELGYELDAVNYQSANNFIAGTGGQNHTYDANNLLKVDVEDIRGTASPATAGYMGPDWSHVNSPASANDLSNTTIKGVDGVTFPATFPTAAGIATAVWQDSTAGDFTAAGSIGKCLFTSGNAPGAAGGFITLGTGSGQIQPDGTGKVTLTASQSFNNTGQKFPLPASLVSHFPDTLLTPVADPTGVSGLLAWYQSSTSTMFKDAGVTPVSADGDPIKQWNDSSGNGRNATQATTGSALVYGSQFGVAVQAYGSDTWITVPSGVSFSSQNFTFGAILDLNNQRDSLDGTPTNQPFHVLFQSAASNCNISLDRSGMVNLYDGSLHACTGTPIPAGSTGVIDIVSTASGVQVWWNGVQVQQLTSAIASNTISGGNVGDYSSGGTYPLNARIRDVWFYSAANTAQQIRSRLPYAYSRGVSPGYAVNVVIDGDSLTAGKFCVENRNWPTKLGFPGNVRWVNIAENALALATALSEQSTHVWPNLVPNLPNVVIVWLGTNDIAINSQTAAQVYANLQTYCTNAKSQGAVVIVATMISRTGITDSIRTTLNTSIRNGFSGATLACDAVADLAADSVFNSATGYSNSTYYNADGVHLTDFGYAVAANYFRQAVWSVLFAQMNQVASSALVGGVARDAITPSGFATGVYPMQVGPDLTNIKQATSPTTLANISLGGDVGGKVLGGGSSSITGIGANVNATQWGGTNVGGMPNSGNVTVGGFAASLVDANGLLKTDVQDWGAAVVNALASGNVQVQVASVANGAITASAFAAGALSGNVQLAANGLDLVLIESGITGSANLVNDAAQQLTSINARQALAVAMAAAAGLTSGAGTTGFVIHAAGLSAKTRVSATTDAAGDRTALALTVPT